MGTATAGTASPARVEVDDIKAGSRRIGEVRSPEQRSGAVERRRPVGTPVVGAPRMRNPVDGLLEN